MQGGCAADQIDHDLPTDQRPASPVGGDVAEHAMFNLVPFAGAGREVVVNLIGSTTTLPIKAGLDENMYAPGIKVSDEELATLVIERDEFHGEWNYRLRPRDLHV